MDEGGFQRTMRYIFTFIEKVRITSSLPPPYTHTHTHTHTLTRNK